MRLLKINNIEVEIDDQTAIGVNYQSYDIKTPATPFVKTSNTFTIPATSNNLAIIGNANNVQSLSTKVYGTLSLNYWNDNEQVLKNAKTRVVEVNERISLFVFEKKDIWDELKAVLWPDFIESFIPWMQINKGLPSLSNPYTFPTLSFLTDFSNNTEGIVLTMFYSNLFNFQEEDEDFLEDETNIYLNYKPIDTGFSAGSHWCIYIKTIFEYIEDTFDVNFLTSGGVLVGNIWDDPIANGMYITAPNIDIVWTDVINGIYFIPKAPSTEFLPLTQQEDKTDKTLYDLVVAFMLHLNILKDEIEVDGEDVIRFTRFDDIETVAPVVDWSGKLDGIPTFKPNIEGYAQNNFIKFKSVFPEGNSLLNSKTLTNSNLGADLNTDIIEIDAYVPAAIPITGGVSLDLSISDAFKTFVFLINSGLTDNSINVHAFFGGTSSTNEILGSLRLQKAALFSLADEYNFLDEIITTPKFYIVKKWLTQSDLKNFEHFAQYFIRELNGSFFVNKISGFNPDKALQATTLELIRLGNRTPITPPSLDYFHDGVGDPFTDGEGDYFI